MIDALPRNISAERAILGSLLIDNSLIPQALARLESSSFFSPTNQIVWGAVAGVAASGVGLDLLTLNSKLETTGQLERVGGAFYIASLVADLPSAANFPGWMQIVTDAHTSRRIIAAAADSAKSAISSGPMEVIASLRKQLDDMTILSGSVKDAELVGDIIVRVMERFCGNRQKPTAMKTGLRALDSMIDGLEPATMTIIGARPSIGKTALAVNIAEYLACSGVPVGILSLEMTANALVDRLVRSMAHVPSSGTELSRSEAAAIFAAAERVRSLPISIDDSSRLTAATLRVKCQRMADKGAKVIMIDYLQLISAPSGNKNSNREQEIAAVSREIKAIAKEFGLAMVALAQLSREAESAKDRPKLSHLRESGGIEADADIVMLLHRDRDQQIGSSPDTAVPAEIIVAKNRNGPTGMARIEFIPSLTRFIDSGINPNGF